MFRVVLNLEVNSPHVSKFDKSISKEDVFSSVNWSSVIVTSSSLEHACVVGVESNKSILNFTEVESSVSISIVSLDKEIDFVRSWVHSNCSKSISNFER